jgi:hypothetical protein
MNNIGNPILVGKLPTFLCIQEDENVNIYTANYGDDSISKVTIRFEKKSFPSRLFFKLKEFWFGLFAKRKILENF